MSGARALLALVDTRHDYEHLSSIYIPIAIGVFAVVVLAILFCVLRYRRRPPERAARWHENNRLEGGYALVLAGVVAFLLYLTFTAEHRVDTVSARERPSVIVDVTGSKWEWTFRYRDYGITQRTGTVGRQPLVVPTGQAVRFNLSTTDVIHAFWVPEVRFKRDLIPGATQSVTLVFPDAGTFQGQCAEFCGLRHADMVFIVRAVAPATFAAWARSGGKATIR
ncbi:MAG: cytochrome c oxidase subunit II [Solirubrobacteraceae bacterium]